MAWCHQATCYRRTHVDRDLCRRGAPLSPNAWWRHPMETFSALLAICAGNSPVSGEFPAQRTVTRSFDVFFDLRLNKRLSKQQWGWWFETPAWSLWRHRNGNNRGCIPRLLLGKVNPKHWHTRVILYSPLVALRTILIEKQVQPLALTIVQFGFLYGAHRCWRRILFFTILQSCVSIPLLTKL